MRLKDAALGKWLTITGNKFHPSLVMSKNVEEEEVAAGVPRKNMGWCIHTDAPIPRDTCLVSCSIDIAITPRKAGDQIAKLLSAGTLSELPNRITLGDKNLCDPNKSRQPRLKRDPAFSSWLDHQVMCLYLMLTRLAIQLRRVPASPKSAVRPGCFKNHILDLFSFHVPYVDSLPCDEDLMTPLYWNSSEMEKLRYTNLYQATLDRKRDWSVEFDDLMDKVKNYNEDLHGYLFDTLSGSDYTWAATILSSRAFPSTLLENRVRRADLISSQVYTENAFKSGLSTDHASFSEPVPVLLPGVDILNHQRGIKVEWRPRDPRDPKSRVEIINLEELIRPGSQVFNNYGAKSTAEFILGYGFALDQTDWDRSSKFGESSHNPDDLYTLKISPPRTAENRLKLIKQIFDSLDKEKLYHNLTIKNPLPKGLLAQLRLLVATTQEEFDIIEAAFLGVETPCLAWTSSFYHSFLECMQNRVGWENELNALDCLKSMLEIQYKRLNEINWSNEDPSNWTGVRDSIKNMIQIYRTGQRDILFESINTLDKIISQTMDQAEADGFVFMEEEEEASDMTS
ncbi:hypothetical protein CROQUDRAFT_70703 [Cronartium quercuum f. sp. fusiforme G11]|uniref:SET domain-containing protein n=1 Tax=Cronartium quercuum f. sp. fusiforme G11 TaxID=708437 RepID=A0A9P6P001_9BASI|nr:hypothetical protein CROQUDRAFT_70703 [Cronartium quercuum f. sp. fusiforme G11]